MVKTTLKDLLNAGKLEEHKTTREEMQELFSIIERDIKDASIKELSPDRRFATAYNAVLQAAKAILYSKGYRPTGANQHATTFTALRQTLGKEHHQLISYFDSCRVKRNITDYDHAGRISETEAEELLEEAKKFTKYARQQTTQ